MTGKSKLPFSDTFISCLDETLYIRVDILLIIQIKSLLLQTFYDLRTGNEEYIIKQIQIEQNAKN